MREPYTLPDDQCERLKRSEMTAVRMLLAGLSTAGYAREDLQERLKAVPDGNGRLRRSLGLMKAVADDLVGTISKAQCRQIYGTMKDFEMRLVPKLTPMSQNVIMTAEEAKELLECARWKCRDCIEDGDSCRKCKLYKLLEATTPMEDYGTGMICPYSAAKWE